MKIPLPSWVVRQVSKFIDIEASGETAVVDNRIHEYAFVLSELALMPVGNLIDVGCAARLNVVPAFACHMGWRVYGLDKRAWNYQHPNFLLLNQTLDTPLPENKFDVVVALSTLEHVGIAGRYGIKKQDEEADIKALDNLRDATKAKGILLLTVPYNQGEYLVKPLGRIYNWDRLNKLLYGWTIIYRELTPDWTTIMIRAEKL
jgi:SAM-dependent methyltransferase